MIFRCDAINMHNIPCCLVSGVCVVCAVCVWSAVAAASVALCVRSVRCTDCIKYLLKDCKPNDLEKYIGIGCVPTNVLLISLQFAKATGPHFRTPRPLRSHIPSKSN